MNIRITGILPTPERLAALHAPKVVAVIVQGYSLASGEVESVRFVEDGIEISLRDPRPEPTSIPSNGVPRQDSARRTS